MTAKLTKIPYLSLKLNTTTSKINPNSLGWIRPDGIISFRDNFTAMKYAKNMCQNALHLSSPFERAVVVKDNLILGVSNGSATNSQAQELKVLQNRIMKNVEPDIILVHGHPDAFGQGKTLPLSTFGLGDLACLLKFKLKSIIALNSRGEFNSATRTAKLTKEKFIEAEQSFEELLLEKLGVAQLYKRYQDLSKQIKKTTDKNVLSILRQERKEIFEQIGNIEKNTLKSNDYAKALHEAYKECLPNAGIEYKTNFSNLA